MAETVSFRKFIYHDPIENSNKVWQVKLLNNGTFITEYGRVGAKMQTTEKLGGSYEVDDLIRSKIRKGYREVNLAVPQVELIADQSAPVSLSAKVIGIIDWIFAQAGSGISQYLAATVDELSIDQINNGRSILGEVTRYYKAQNSQSLIYAVKNYYSTIPTKLPNKLTVKVIVETLISHLQDEYDRLDALESAVNSLKITRTGGSNYTALGCEIVEASADDAEKIRKMIENSHNRYHNYRIQIKDVFQVKIPSERNSFENDKRDNNRLLFHGTASKNLRHILGQGLKVPVSYTNGWMFGRGIYFADQSTKSGQYCYSQSGNLKAMFVCDVKLGKSETPRMAVKEPGRGYDSVSALGGNMPGLMNNEYIVYSETQVTIKYIVTWEQVY